jgi:two-component system, chemotaxis family, chemotaxis protein CheY
MEHKRALIVDDFSSMRRMLKMYLERLGYSEILEAEDGDQALDILATQRCQIVIADHLMPNLKGTDLLKRLRGQGQEVPFVVVSDDIRHQDVLATTEFGHTSVLAKPVSVVALRRKIEEAEL